MFHLHSDATPVYREQRAYKERQRAVRADRRSTSRDTGAASVCLRLANAYFTDIMFQDSLDQIRKRYPGTRAAAKVVQGYGANADSARLARF